ncbi:MAG: DUF167 domain-containing protein [bacterium]|nr:DUF167 domain-containing protein [bacterium]
MPGPDAGFDFWVHVHPRASRELVGGEHDGALRVAVRAAPSDGEANRAVCRAVAAALELKNRQISLISGGKSRRKRLRAQGDPQVLASRVQALRETSSV